MNKPYYVGKKDGKIIYSGHNEIDSFGCDSCDKYVTYQAALLADHDFLNQEAQDINQESLSVNTREVFDITDYIRYQEAVDIKSGVVLDSKKHEFIMEQCAATGESPTTVADYYISEYETEKTAKAKTEAARVLKVNQLLKIIENN